MAESHIIKLVELGNKKKKRSNFTKLARAKVLSSNYISINQNPMEGRMGRIELESKDKDK